MIDWVMAIVFFGGSACLIMAITFGGTVYAWDSSSEISLWVITAVLLLVSIFLAKYHPGVDKDHRLYPAHFLKRPILVNLQVQMFLVSGIVFVSILTLALRISLLLIRR